MLALPNLNRENLSPKHVLYFSIEKMADVFKERGYGKQPDLFSLYDNVHFKTPRECLETIYRSAPHDQDCLIELDGLTNMFLGPRLIKSTTDCFAPLIKTILVILVPYFIVSHIT